MVPGEYTDRAAAADFVCGVNPVLECLRRGRVRRVFVARGARGGAADVAREASAAGIPVVTEDPARLRSRAAGAVHQGVVAEVEPYAYADWHEMLAEHPDCLVVADQVTDPRNLGALIRSAEAAGAGALVLPKDRSAGVSPVTAKAAAGATALLRIARVTNLARALGEMKSAGYWIVGLEAKGPKSLYEFTFPERSAIVVGSEGGGLRPLTRSTCDFLVSIPMAGRGESLNVSVAAAVALFERFRQRHRIDTRVAR